MKKQLVPKPKTNIRIEDIINKNGEIEFFNIMKKRK